MQTAGNHDFSVACWHGLWTVLASRQQDCLSAVPHYVETNVRRRVDVQCCGCQSCILTGLGGGL